MMFKVVAKRFGNSVAYVVEAEGTKEALRVAMAEANDIFGFRTGDSGAPTVSVKPMGDEE